MKLDLGSGPRPKEGYLGIDLPSETPTLFYGTEDDYYQEELPTPNEQGVLGFDLSSGLPWPFATHSIDALWSSHFIEHLPTGFIPVYDPKGEAPCRYYRSTGRQDVLFHFLDEAWRVTKPNGEFLLRWPALRDETSKKLCLSAFVDPTHQRFIPLQQIEYWCRQGREVRGVSQYRARCNWIPLRITQNHYGEPPDGLVENEVLFVKEV